MRFAVCAKWRGVLESNHGSVSISLQRERYSRPRESAQLGHVRDADRQFVAAGIRHDYSFTKPEWLRGQIEGHMLIVAMATSALPPRLATDYLAR